MESLSDGELERERYKNRYIPIKGRNILREGMCVSPRVCVCWSLCVKHQLGEKPVAVRRVQRREDSNTGEDAAEEVLPDNHMCASAHTNVRAWR